MEIKELKIKTTDDLSSALKEQRERLRHLKFELAGRKLKNVRELFEVRKTIARILTLIHARQTPVQAKVTHDKKEQADLNQKNAKK